jgi:hypothetical protein
VRAKLIWLALLFPAVYYLLVFFSEGVSLLGEGGLRIDETDVYVGRGIIIVLALAIGLGVINLFAHHAKNAVNKRKDWQYSIIVFVSFFVVAAALLWQYRVSAERARVADPALPALQRIDELRKAQPGLTIREAQAALSPEDQAALQRMRAYQERYHFQPRQFCVNYVRRPLEATVMALLGFYITYAAYRAFRLRSLEATVMMLSAAIVILGSDSFGGWLTGGRLTVWADFDNRVLNSGMQRGLLIGIGVAAIAASLRIMLGLEKGIMGSGQGEQ